MLVALLAARELEPLDVDDAMELTELPVAAEPPELAPAELPLEPLAEAVVATEPVGPELPPVADERDEEPGDIPEDAPPVLEAVSVRTGAKQRPCLHVCRGAQSASDWHGAVAFEDAQETIANPVSAARRTSLTAAPAAEARPAERAASVCP